ncbi:MAG TPA: ATP-binding protein [Polyangiaceae bacterium]|nr:ATP-binding protein [Polyangiaceae bacterium]
MAATAALLRAGLARGLVVPLRHREELLGALFLASPSENLLDPERVAFVVGASARFAQGLSLAGSFAAREQLRIADRLGSSGTLAAGVAHEINNPLTAVIANLEFASMAVTELVEDLPATTRTTDLVESLTDAMEAADRVKDLVVDLGVFSHIAEFRHGPVDVERVLGSTLRLVQDELRQRARLVTEYGNVSAAEANDSGLAQVFLNLLLNAVQAIPEGSADDHEVSVITSQDATGRVVIEVRDTGSGMAPDVLRNIFTPFFTTRPVGLGVGLGLAICQRIVTGFGGEIAVTSRPGDGTSFKVSLPAAGESLPEPSGSFVSILPPRPGRVLVIDDDVMVGATVERLLSAEHDVEFCSSATDALKVIAAGNRFDVILCDVLMPVLTGVDFYEELARVDHAQLERVVFLTDSAFKVPTRDFLASLPNAQLEKPFDARQLRAVVNGRVRP